MGHESNAYDPYFETRCPRPRSVRCVSTRCRAWRTEARRRL